MKITILTLCVLTFLLNLSTETFAVNFTVTRTDDRNKASYASGDCSLREAVAAANSSASDDTINFAPGIKTIMVSDTIVVNGTEGALTINGTGFENLTIKGVAGNNGIIHTINAAVTISGVTLTGGNGTLGGGILAESGSLTLDRVHITGNSANQGGGLYFTGAGIYHIINSTISGNTAFFHCAGLINRSDSYLIMVNSTISGNTAPNVGGGLCNYGIASLRNVTLTNNTALQSSGIYNEGELDFGNSIVAGNNETGFAYAPEINIENGSVSSVGYNLVGDSPGDSKSGYYSFPIYYDPTDILDTNPLLGALQNNGGTTLTHELLAGSPAIDKGINALVSPLASVFDQRGTGFARIRDGNADGTATVDIGAFEVQSSATVNRPTLFDFDGDGKADVSVFRLANGTWYLQQSANGFSGFQFGFGTDKLTPADYDGDGKTDIAVYRNSTWYLQRSRDGFLGIAFGLPTDIPVPADYSGDGKSEIAVFRPPDGIWYIYNLANNQFTSTQLGQAGDIPVAGDYDGDGKSDVAVFRSGTWYIQRTSNGFFGIVFGQTGDKPVPADYDGDGKTDVAVFRPSNGTWYLLQSRDGFTGAAFGFGTDLPVPADYDGDGKADIAVFRNGIWYLQRSQSGFTGVAFGEASDKPVPNAFVP